MVEVEVRPKTSGRSATPKEIEEWAAKKGEAYSPKNSPKGATPSPPAAAAAAAEASPKLPDDNPKAVARMLASGRGPLGTSPSEDEAIGCGYKYQALFSPRSARHCTLPSAALSRQHPHHHHHGHRLALAALPALRLSGTPPAPLLLPATKPHSRPPRPNPHKCTPRHIQLANRAHSLAPQAGSSRGYHASPGRTPAYSR